LSQKIDALREATMPKDVDAVVVPITRGR